MTVLPSAVPHPQISNLSPHPLPALLSPLLPRSFGEEHPEENRVHLGHAIMSFYAALIDLLGRCAPEMHVSIQNGAPKHVPGRTDNAMGLGGGKTALKQTVGTALGSLVVLFPPASARRVQKRPKAGKEPPCHDPSSLQLIQTGKGEALRIRAILRSLVPLDDLVGIISLPLQIPTLGKGVERTPQAGGESLRPSL